MPTPRPLVPYSDIERRLRRIMLVKLDGLVNNLDKARHDLECLDLLMESQEHAEYDPLPADDVLIKMAEYYSGPAEADEVRRLLGLSQEQNGK